MREGFCPRCERARPGYLRYCLGCGFDFDVPALIEPDPEIPAVTQAFATASEVRPGAKPTPRGRMGRRIGRYAVIGMTAVLGLSALSNLVATPSSDVVDPTGTSPTSSAATTASPFASNPEPTFGPTGQTAVGIVTQIIDGDTIRVQIDGNEYPVRYIGMDTPEPDATDPAIKQLADAATAANAALVEGQEVILERDVSEADQFDRLLRNVWLEDNGGLLILVNLELIHLGYAQVSTYPPDVKYVDELTAAQEIARSAALGLWAPARAPAPEPTPLVTTNVDPLFIVADEREQFGGAIGSYTWSSVAFEGDRVTVRWKVIAPSKADCRVGWQIQPGSDAAIKSTIRVKAGNSGTGNRRYDTPFSSAAFVVSSTCAKWGMSMQVDEAPTSGGNCDPSYPDFCIPPYPPDLDCNWVYNRGSSHITVRGSDPHGFDGNNDGEGCESR